ncbi:hypothetical protein, partial [Acinetobacter baumannii]
LSFLVTAAFSSYVQAATSVNDILNKQIIATNSENINSTKVVSELCIFSCDLLSTNPEVSYGGMDELYVLLREKYGLDSKQSCKFYKRTTGNVILDTQYKIAALQGTPNPDAYSDSIFNNLIYKQGIYSSSDVNVDIYYDLVDIARINNPELDENSKNNLVKTFQMRHRFIANSCGEKFMMAYDKYLNKVSELREAEYIEAINKKNAKEREKEEWEEEIRLAKQARDRADAEREEQARLIDAKKRENRQKINLCKSTNNYKLFIESSNVVSARNSIKVAQDVLKEEDRLQSFSGVTRLDRRYAAAQRIEYGQKTLNQSFAKYKQLGGSASSVATVTPLNNPCKGL